MGDRVLFSQIRNAATVGDLLAGPCPDFTDRSDSTLAMDYFVLHKPDDSHAVISYTVSKGPRREGDEPSAKPGGVPVCVEYDWAGHYEFFKIYPDETITGKSCGAYAMTPARLRSAVQTYIVELGNQPSRRKRGAAVPPAQDASPDRPLRAGTVCDCVHCGGLKQPKSKCSTPSCPKEYHRDCEDAAGVTRVRNQLVCAFCAEREKLRKKGIKEALTAKKKAEKTVAETAAATAAATAAVTARAREKAAGLAEEQRRRRDHPTEQGARDSDRCIRAAEEASSAATASSAALQDFIRASKSLVLPTVPTVPAGDCVSVGVLKMFMGSMLSMADKGNEGLRIVHSESRENVREKRGVEDEEGASLTQKRMKLNEAERALRVEEAAENTRKRKELMAQLAALGPNLDDPSTTF